jgi:hypothetical protein
MKTNASSRSAFSVLRIALSIAFCSAGIVLGLAAGGSTCAGDVLSSAERYTPGAPNQSCLSPPAGLVSWWAGDEDATDLQGNNPGKLMKGAIYAPGFVSRAAFSFDGIDDVVQVGDRPDLKMTTAMTMECWVYPTGVQDSLFVNKEGEYEFGVDHRDGGQVFWAFANTDPGWISILTGFVLPLESWTHVAVTYDNGLITTYGNGLQVHQYQGSGVIGDVSPTLNDFRIGNRQQFPGPFPGRIDELKVYDRAISADEVAAIYAAGSSGNCKPVVFVEDLTPYAIPKAEGEYKVGTTIQIMDAQGHLVSGAIVRVTITLPDGGSISGAVTTDSLGNADYSIFSSAHGTYVFKVERVTKLGRQYGRARNVETRAQITIL